jgi:hypothetical protein
VLTGEWVDTGAIAKQIIAVSCRIVNRLSKFVADDPD